MANGFDKDAAKKPASKGKVVTMIVLAGVLGVIGYFHFASAPQAADAANATPNSDLDSIGSATDQIALLVQSPTRNLLLHTTAPSASTDDLRINPFAISSVWLIALNPPKPAVATAGDPTPIRPLTVGPIIRAPINVDAIKQTIKLQGIFKQAGGRVAFINDNVLGVGAIIDKIPTKVQIFDILEDRIILQVPGYGDDGKFEISLSPKLNP
jgi:hypothetical protein